jgi:hypothetical protein
VLKENGEGVALQPVVVIPPSPPSGRNKVPKPVQELVSGKFGIEASALVTATKYIPVAGRTNVPKYESLVLTEPGFNGAEDALNPSNEPLLLYKLTMVEKVKGISVIASWIGPEPVNE